jgi:hypothetical protein
MVFGMTRGEIGLVVFLFVLIYAGVLVPKAGARLGAYFARGRKSPGGDPQTPGAAGGPDGQGLDTP